MLFSVDVIPDQRQGFSPSQFRSHAEPYRNNSAVLLLVQQSVDERYCLFLLTLLSCFSTDSA